MPFFGFKNEYNYIKEFLHSLDIATIMQALESHHKNKITKKHVQNKILPLVSDNRARMLFYVLDVIITAFIH